MMRLPLCAALLALLAGCTGEIGADQPPGPGVGIDSDGDGVIDGFDTDGDGVIDSDGVDSDGDGVPDTVTPDDPSQPVDNGPDAIAAACAAKNGALDVGLTRLRRLTRAQYNNTVRALVGTAGEPANAIAPDEKVGPFHSNAIAPITDLIVEQHQEVAKLVAADAQARMGELTPCDLNADTTGACATQFIEQFGLRAYRRPLEAVEVENYLSLYTLGQQNSGAAHGFALVVEAMLQSPFFLYHRALGGASTPSATPIAVTAYELASRLSYFLYNSMPDDELFALAASGALLDEATLSGEVERMLATDAAGATLGLFHRQWLGLEKLPEKEKDPAVFPSYSATTVDEMLAETSLFADYVIRQGDGLMSTLFTASYSFPQGSLFGIYGVAEPAGFTPGMRVDLNPAERAGLLTQPAFLATNAHRDQTSPVHRGIIVRENVLCQPIPSPPNNANTTPPIPSEATTTRERFAQHVEDPSCANCHQLMDPIGLGFENYDPVGAWRTNDGLSAVDASGELVSVADDLIGPFNGALELAGKLATSKEAQSCLANQWFRFALGRSESDADACSMQSIHEGFDASGGNVRSLMAEIALSEAFRNVRGQE